MMAGKGGDKTMSILLPLASGSTGNCMLLVLGERKLLVDMGISLRRVTAGLKSVGLTPGDLDGVLITHAHTDHTSGLAMLHKYWPNVPLFASATTLTRLAMDGEALPRSGETSLWPELALRTFATSHDCPGSMGFVLDWAGQRLGYATDLGVVTDSILSALEGSSFQVLEFNHDVEMLRHGPYPYPLQQRILSDEGHLCNEAGADAAAWLNAHGTKRFLLAHLSQQNNTPALAMQAAGIALAGTDAEFSPAPVGMGPVYVL